MTRDLEREVEETARELAERYEEINLLYSISEILGRTVSLDEATDKILHEVSDTVGARSGVIYVIEPDGATLAPIAVVGTRGPVKAVAVSDERSLASRAFRERHSLVIAPEDDIDDDGYRRGAVLAVPITWTGQDLRPVLLGVICLTERTTGAPFSAGDSKLITAIATQIGSAIQNARLVRASIEQQRLAQEMRLAHDLQMKLLPSVGVVAPNAHAAARVVPAESVGGDFYHLFRLTPTITGVMIGDVSSHGYRAALIMALAMSAAAIHAQSTLDPGAMLHALLHSMRDELESTEMFITLFYGIIDRDARTLTYANTGHPHAFVCHPHTDPQRIGALDPPLGMSTDAPSTRVVPWDPQHDLLVLFTDGITDALNANGEVMGEKRVLDAITCDVDIPPEEVVRRVFTALEDFTGGVRPRDDLTLVVVRN